MIGAISFFLLLPLVASRLPGVTRERVFEGLDRRQSITAIHRRLIFDEKGPVDVAIIGSSRIWTALDAALVQTALREHGHPSAVALTLGMNHPAEDMIYVVLKDLLAQRKVRMLVIGQPARRQTSPHPELHRLFDPWLHFGVWRGLGWPDRARLYALSVLGAPRIALNALRKNLPPGPSADLREHRGAFIRALNFGHKLPFVQHHAPPPEGAPSILTSTGHRADLDVEAAEKFDFDPVSSPYQRYFMEEIMKLAAQHQIPVVMLAPPTLQEASRTKPHLLVSKEFVAEHRLSVVAVAPADLFSGVHDPGRVEDFYADSTHLNQNGSRLFTQTMLPTLVKLYEQYAAK